MTRKISERQFERNIAIFTVTMGFLAWMAVKLPMPALPSLANVFHTSSQVLKASVTLNLISFSVSQIFWGPISDRYGRRPVLLAMFILAIIGTLFAMLATNIYLFVLGRIIEGFAVGGTAPLGRAAMADKLEKIKIAKVYAWFSIAAILPPAVGPVIGGYLLVFFGWRSIFAFFLMCAFIFLIAIYYWFYETHDNRLAKLNFHYIKSSILFIATSSKFWTYVICYGLINGFMIAYYAAMPYWYVVQFHMAEQDYAWLAFFPIAGYILGSIITNRLLTIFRMETLLVSGIVLSIVVGLLILFSTFFIKPTIILVNSYMTLFSIASGIVTPMTNVNLIHTFREKVTILSAIMSGMRICGAGLLVLVSANIPLQSYLPLGIYTLCIALIALLSYLFFRKRIVSSVADQNL